MNFFGRWESEFNFSLTPAGIYLLKVNNRSTRTRCEICSKLTIKTPERPLRKIPKFHLISWCGNFVERQSFHIASGESLETMRKLYLSTKFPHQDIRWNYGTLYSGRQWYRSGLFIVNFEHISLLVIVFLSLTLNM